MLRHSRSKSNSFKKGPLADLVVKQGKLVLSKKMAGNKDKAITNMKLTGHTTIF